MTIRKFLNNKLRKIMAVILSGFALFIIGIIYSIMTDTKTPPIISLLGFGLAFIAMFYVFFGIRCPNCNNIIGYVVMYKGPFIPDSILSMSKKIKYCVYCGVNMDSEIKSEV